MLVQTANGAGLFPAQVIYGDLTHMTIFTPHSLAQLLRASGFVDLAFTDIPRIPLYQPYVNVAMQKNVSGYQYWFHRRLDYRALVKA